MKNHLACYQESNHRENIHKKDFMEVNAEKHVLKMFETNGKEKEGRETGRRK